MARVYSNPARPHPFIVVPGVVTELCRERVLVSEFVEGGLIKKPDRFRPDKVLSQFLDATWWYLTDEEIELEPHIATQVMINMSDPRSQHFGQMRH